MALREPSPRPPFDQGLFLAHLNKGKEHYEAKHYDEAERQLEEAYLLRPRDPTVLNLLGLVYFRQEKFDRAEEVYRKLVAESPDAQTLHHNLGLVYLKLQRLEEAESAFLKALDLGEKNPKINFYLGSIYERQRRFPDAIYQYRQAGANIMVRRVEDKMAAATAKQPPRPSPKAADTAKFKAAEIQAAFKRREEADPLAPPRPIQPVSPNLMVPESAVTEAGPTSRVRLAEVLIPPAAPRQEPLDPRPPRLRSAAPPVEPPTDRTLPSARRPEPFRFVQSNLMEIDFSGKVFIKQGTIYSYSGNLTFWVKEKRPGGQPALVIITGSGRVLLTDGDREITFMQVQDETIFVAPPHLLACEETLTPRYVALGDGSSTLEFLALEGTGMVALSVARKPIPIEVTRELPVSVPAVSVITWSGALQPRVVKDRQLHEIMLPGREQEPVLRLEGDGRVLVEQANVH